MNWSDEHYVKLYTRDTLTWRSWGWKTRTLFLHLVRKLDGAGIIETGKMLPANALALQLELPTDFVAEALPPLLADGTAEICAGGVLLPKFVEAQEARKTDRLRKADERQRTADRRRITQATESPEAHVTRRHTASQPVTLQPSPAQPSPEKPRVAKAPLAPRGNKSKPAPDPRHAPLVKLLVEAAPGYTFVPRDGRGVTELLALSKGDNVEVLMRWRRALAWPKPFPTVRAIHELATFWPHFEHRATDGKPAYDPNQGIIRGSHPPPLPTPPTFTPVEVPF